MTDAPEKIWADKEFGYDDWDAGTFCTVSDGGTEYIRYDKHTGYLADIRAAYGESCERIKELEEVLKDVLCAALKAGTK